MSLSEIWPNGVEVVSLLQDDVDDTIPLPEADESGNRFQWICCCDCGLVHAMRIGQAEIQFRRANDKDAEAIRRVATEAGHTFPLRPGTAES